MKWDVVVVICAYLVGYVVSTPQQIHIALAGQDEQGYSNSMTISWVTEERTATSIVKYGMDANQLDHIATGSSASYLKTFDHHVTLGTLKPGTRYYYQCGDDKDGWSDVHTFVSSPSSPNSFTMSIFGDMGVVNSENTMNLLRKLSPNLDLLWHIGDISYADDWFIRGLANFFEFGYEATWNQYMNEMQSVVSSRPYMVLTGNHEGTCHSPACILSLHNYYAKLRNFTAFNARFKMPSTESGGTKNMWYSYNYGPVHFVSISTETDYPGAPEGLSSLWRDGGFGQQLKWLEEDLKKAASERSIRPWILVGGHRPMYTIGNWDDKQMTATGYARALQNAMEDLFHKYGVDMYFAGHVHAYERQYPVYKGVHESSYNAPNSTVHIVIGCGGNVEGHEHFGRSPAWNAAKDGGNFGLGVLNVTSTHLEWEFYDAASESVLDRVTITKPASTA